MIDLDQRYDHPTHEQNDGLGVSVDDDDRDRVLFRPSCGARGYICVASFRDPVGFGGGITPREALRSLAKSLRQLVDKVERVANTPTKKDR